MTKVANSKKRVNFNLDNIGSEKQKFSALNCKYFLTHNFSTCFRCSKELSH